jgi:hypothetical protein
MFGAMRLKQQFSAIKYGIALARNAKFQLGSPWAIHSLCITCEESSLK